MTGTDPDSSLRNKQDSTNSTKSKSFLAKRKVVSLEVSFTFSIHIMKIPFPKEGSPVGIINKHDKVKIKGIVITPTTTQEFGLSPGKDGFELGYSEEQPLLRTEY
ncbi:hypothetical protein Bca4012_077116 [Brassica carinata]